MRFRTHIINVSLLHKIAKYLAVMAKTCVVKLAEGNIHFIVSGTDGGPEGVQIWSQVKVDTLFSQYRIESRTNNEIYLEIALEGFLKALRSAETANAGNGPVSEDADDALLTMKLTKKNDRAMLTFDVRGFTSSTHVVEITHEVPVQVLGPSRVKDLKEPLCPEPDMHMQLPPMQQLKGFASRLSHMAGTVTISANLEGKMTFTVKSDEMELETTWNKLTIPTFNRKDPEEDDSPPPSPKPRDHMYSVQIGVKSLLRFLTTNLTNSTTIACICSDFCMIAYIYIGEVDQAGGVMTFFIPAVSVHE